MRKCLSVLLLSLVSVITLAKVDLVPAPQKIAWGQGAYTLPQQSAVAYAQPALKPAAEYLQTCLKRYAQTEATVASSKQGDIRLSLKKGLPKDGYELKITTTGIELVGADYGGIMAAIASLNQMLILSSGQSLTSVSISDAPRLGSDGEVSISTPRAISLLATR